MNTNIQASPFRSFTSHLCRIVSRVVSVVAFVGLVLATARCSSFELGVFSQIPGAPSLVANLNCALPGESVTLSPHISVEITSGSQGFGIVQLKRVVMEYCVDPVAALLTQESTNNASSNDACEAISEPILATNPSSLTACPLFSKQACMPSLRFPRGISCGSPPQGQPEDSSRCFLSRNATFRYQNSTSFPLRSLNQEGYTPRTNQWWGQVCCEAASQECSDNTACAGRGTCQGRCRESDRACSANSDCPPLPQKCLSLCDDLFQQCTTNSECPRPNPRVNVPGNCAKRCQRTGASCTTDDDCQPVAQPCLRICYSVGTTCTESTECARGESCARVCNTSHTLCSADNDCSSGESCQSICIPSAHMMVYVGFLSDAETSYAQHASPRKMRLICRDSNGRIDLNARCQPPATLNDPAANACATTNTNP